MPSTPTADLCDANEPMLASGALRVLAPIFTSFGGAAAFAGPVSTIRCFEDNSLVRTTLEQAGGGRVLVVDGGGSKRCALVGGKLGLLAQDNGWAGIVVYGCVRDTAELRACRTGILALGAHPRRSDKRGGGQSDIAVEIAGVRVEPGQWCYCDADGTLISDTALD